MSWVVSLDGASRLPREVLGNKGFGINLMRGGGLPVPPAFCLVTDVCTALLDGDERVVDRVWPDLLDGLRGLEDQTASSFGGGSRPLLLAVRSGAAVSMPGMLDTVLDVGIDDAVHRALASKHTAEFADDTGARFSTMYRRIVLGGDSSAEVPDDPLVQLRGAIQAVLASWSTPRSIAYRAHHGLDDTGGIAVVVQAMVFGDLGPDSGSGVLFSRNPATGADEPLGEWLPGVLGEDVVSGAFDCLPLHALRAAQPGVFAELMAASDELERLGGDVQDIEFTVEGARLWLLQTRVAKRSPQAAVRLALTFRDAGLIDDAEVLRRVTPSTYGPWFCPRYSPRPGSPPRCWPRACPHSPGVASGRAYTDLEAALDAADADEDVILVRVATTSQGCSRPARSSPRSAARPPMRRWSVASSAPAVVGCGAGVATSLDGRVITVDGGEGKVFDGALELAAWAERDSLDLVELAAIARRLSPLRAHASGPHPNLVDVSEAGVRDALARGLTDVVCDTPLIAMLTAVRLAADDDPRAPRGSPDG